MPSRAPTAITPALLLVLGAIGVLGGCGGDEPSRSPPPVDPPAQQQSGRGPQERPEELARADGEAQVQTVATGLEVPWEIAFLPDGRALVTERPGRVRLLSRDLELAAEPLAVVPVASVSEAGLLGLAVDPSFEQNGFVYLYRTTEEQTNEVVRYRLEGGELTEQAVVAGGIRASPIHDGGRIHFGPDQRLYVSTGDAGRAELAQDPDSLNGKFLRLEPEQYRGDQAPPEVFTLGHRNPQGFDWQPGSDRLIASEHGPTGNDEINDVVAGDNYGWPEVEGSDHGRFTAPLTVYEESIAPSGATFVSLPGSEWTGDLLVAALVGEQVRRLSFDGGEVTGDRALFEGDFGRLRTVVEGPDGALYTLTNNRDGRGSPTDEDDRILRIVPPAD